MVFNCLTNYRFLQQRIQGKNVGIYSLIKDLEFSICCPTIDKKEKTILDNLCSVLVKDKNVIAGCPELLYSCLRNASKLTQETILRNKMSTPYMETIVNPIDFRPTPVPSDMDCCAFSHDKKLFAVGQGRCFYLFDTCTYQKVLGPIEVIDSEMLSHLEFSSDDKFVFFGRLDKWFSVHEKRVVKISQFAGNVKCYKWGSFVYDGSYIAVIKNEIDHLHLGIVRHIFAKAWLHEISLKQPVRYRFKIFSNATFSNFSGSSLSGLLPELPLNEINYYASSKPEFCQYSSCKLCSRYRKFKKKKKSVRDQVVDLYSDIFEYQIWNVKTGKSVIEEMFSTQMKPFFFIWHIFREFQSGSIPISITDKTITKVVLVKLLYCCGKMYSGCILHKDISYLCMNVPAQCCSRVPNYVFSKNGKWFAKKEGSEFELWEQSGNDIYEKILVLDDVKDVCCTHDNLFVCFTDEPNPNLYAFSVETGVILRSMSGLCPISYISGDYRRSGYIFCYNDKRIKVCLRDLSGKFLLECLCRDASKSSRAVDAKFTSTDTIMFVYVNSMFMSLTVEHGVLPCSAGMLELDYSQNIIVKKCIFSHNGKLIAIHHSCEILLFDCEGKFLSSVFKVTKEDELNASLIKFSPDDSLLIFCIQKHNDNQSFHVWKVNDKMLSNHIHFSSDDRIDSCCFAPDNSKIFFCNAFGVFIQHYPAENSPSLTRYTRNAHYRSVCGHCAVSPDNKLLVCCIANEILVHPLDGPTAFWKVTHNHSSMIKSCNFLKGNRYLISYGIDDILFLFDLLLWKPVAFARQESIIAMAISPDEDKVVCIGSSGELVLINLHGLKCGSPSIFQLPLDFRLPEKNFQPQKTQGISPPDQCKFKYFYYEDEDE